MGARTYNDRSLSIRDHAVARFRERTGAHHMDREECRRLIGLAVRGARHREYPHYVVGQTVVRVTILGVEVFAVIGRDLTGWSNSGRAVVTVLTEEQLDASWKARS